MALPGWTLWPSSSAGAVATRMLRCVLVRRCASDTYAWSFSSSLLSTMVWTSAQMEAFSGRRKNSKTS